MKFLLLICADPTQVPDDAFARGCEGWTEEMQRRGVLQGGGTGLHAPAAARTVRVRPGVDDDEISITDGPFAETKELIGGTVILDCPTLEEAVAFAARHPSARYGAIEVRPIWDPATPPPWS
ncbi:YciI family protein [Kribbella sancticallisti]|uniref:YciI family protein n=1 Tax=Kribbella sancticallisti TaxID=460087 RepID=A0ABN2D437_9ACTN